jgi:glycolate oxidase
MGKNVNKGHHPLYKLLGTIVGSEYVADEDFARVAYSRDAGPYSPTTPGVIVRPGTTEEISEILKAANRTLTPVTLRGGGASLFGFTRGEPGKNILIDMTRLDKIIAIDEENQKVTYEGGIRPSVLDGEVRKRQYHVHTVWAAFRIDTMAGLLSGVAGGGDPFNHMTVGSNWHYVLGLKVVLPNGDVITTGAGPDTNIHRKEIFMREAASPDATGLFIGSGGIFGVITEITSMIFPLQRISRFGSFLFDAQEDKWEAMLNLSNIYPFPYTGIIGHDSMAMEQFGIYEGPGFGLFYTVEGNGDDDVDRRVVVIERICKDARGRPGTAAMDDWAANGMTGTGKAIRQNAPACPTAALDAAYPRKGSFQFHQGLIALVDAHKGEMTKLGITRMDSVRPKLGNAMWVGVVISWNDAIPGASEKALEIVKEGYDYMIKSGTSSWGCQGEGSILWASAWSPSYYNFIRTLKRGLDPNNILCPGLWNV